MSVNSNYSDELLIKITNCDKTGKNSKTKFKNMGITFFMERWKINIPMRY